MVCNSVKVAFQIVSGISACVFIAKGNSSINHKPTCLLFKLRPVVSIPLLLGYGRGVLVPGGTKLTALQKAHVHDEMCESAAPFACCGS